MLEFEGIWVPLITPFRGGEVDLPAAQKLARRLVDEGVDGLALCGTTGEPATMDDAEQARLLAAVLEAVDGACPVLFGLAGYDTATVAARAAALDASGAAGLLISAPYYVRPSQEGVRLHFEAIAQATELPIVLYNIPYRTGVNIALDTARALAENPRFVAIKECGGNLAQLRGLIETTPLKVLSGEDDLIFVACCLGGHGAISAAAHLRPDLYRRMIDHIRAGRLPAARAIARVLQPMVRLLFSEPNPGPIKAALALQGEIAEELRLPMTPVSAACRAELERALPAFMAWNPPD